MIVEDGRQDGPKRLKQVAVSVLLLLAVLALKLAVADGRLAAVLQRFSNTHHQTERLVAEATPPVSEVDGDTLNARWEKFAPDAQLPDYMPQKAMEAGVSGKSTVVCRWDAAGRVSGCTILSETPAGYGFGQATLRLLYDHGRVVPARPDEPFGAGEGLVMRFRWTLE